MKVNISRRAAQPWLMVVLVALAFLAPALSAAQAPVVCTEAALRAAMNSAAQEAVLKLPANCTIVLTGAAGEDNNTTGDLDFTASANPTATAITIQGAGPGRTIIDGGQVDRVFDVGLGKSLTLTDLTLRNGDAHFVSGGGVSHRGVSLTLINVEVTGNKATEGGGIDADGSITLTNVTISDNSATSGEGGGLALGLGTATLTNVTISGNTATEGGGGFHQTGGTAQLTNVTIANNTGGTESGGLFLDGGSTILTNTILAGNHGSDAADCGTMGGTLTSGGHNLIQTSAGCVLSGGGGTDILNQNALIGPLADNGGFLQTHALQAGSPAIDAGAAAACPATDARGVARPMDGDGNGSAICDIGAIERAFGFQGSVTIGLNRPSYQAGDTLRMSVTLSNSGIAATADVYLGFVLPAGVGPGFGCPTGNAVVFVNSALGIELHCLSDNPDSFPRFLPAQSVPVLSATVVDFFTMTMPGGVPSGSYLSFLALTAPGAFQDGVINPGDVLAFGSAGFAVP